MTIREGHERAQGRIYSTDARMQQWDEFAASEEHFHIRLEYSRSEIRKLARAASKGNFPSSKLQRAA